MLNARLHDAQLGLDQIRLDLESIDPTLNRAKRLIDEQRARRELAEQQQRKRFEALTKRCGIPLVTVQIVVGVVHILVGAWSLKEQPGIPPAITLGCGVVLLIIAFFVLMFIVKLPSPEKTLNNMSKEENGNADSMSSL